MVDVCHGFNLVLHNMEYIWRILDLHHEKKNYLGHFVFGFGKIKLIYILFVLNIGHFFLLTRIVLFCFLI
jgi:hypothetical protein